MAQDTPPITPEDVELPPFLTITTENASQLEQWVPLDENGQQTQEWVAYSRGSLLTTRYSAIREELFAGASTGLYVFDGDNLNAPLAYIADFGSQIDVLVLSPDEQNLIVHSSNHPGHPKIYNLETRQIIELEGNQDQQVYDELQFSVDGQTVYGIGYSTENFRIVSWDAKTGEQVSTDEVPQLSQFVVDTRPYKPTVHLIVTPESYMTSRKLESGFSNTATIIQLWDKGTLEQIQRIELTQEASDFYYIQEHNIFVTSSYQNNYDGALIWDANTGNRIATVSAKGSIRLSLDASTLWFYDRDTGNIQVWDIESQHFVKEYNFDTGQYLAQFTGDQLITTQGGIINIWAIDDESINLLHSSPDLFGGSAGDLVFTHNGDRLLLARSGIDIWNTATWTLTNEIPVDEYIYDIAVSPDNQSVAATLALTNNPEDDMLRIYDLETGAETLAVNYTNTFASVAYHPGENYLAVGRNRGFDLAFYSLQSGVMLSRFVEGGVPQAVSFSPDGTLVASGNYDGNVRVYNTATRQPEYVIDAGGRVESLAFSHDGATLAVGTGFLGFYDARNGQEIYTTDYLDRNIGDIAFSPDDSVLAMIGTYRIVLWDVENNRELWSSMNGNHYADLAFHPDGTILVTSSTNVAMWVINTGADGDGDGVDDIQDACPVLAGDINGCPDSDGDGLIDLSDACPTEVGTANGCPDDDDDGVSNTDDLCPQEIGSIVANGCPDSDSDGVVDADDMCPNEAGVAQFSGCPDRDADNIADSDDLCPSYAGTPEKDGCPNTGHTNTNANIRNAPNTNGAIVRSVPSSEEFYVIGKNTAGDWLHIVLDPDGEAITAWVFASLVITDADIPSLNIDN